MKLSKNFKINDDVITKSGYKKISTYYSLKINYAEWTMQLLKNKEFPRFHIIKENINSEYLIHCDVKRVHNRKIKKSIIDRGRFINLEKLRIYKTSYDCFCKRNTNQNKIRAFFKRLNNYYEQVYEQFDCRRPTP